MKAYWKVRFYQIQKTWLVWFLKWDSRDQNYKVKVMLGAHHGKLNCELYVKKKKSNVSLGLNNYKFRKYSYDISSINPFWNSPSKR